jgi:hypothetical protein
MSSHNSSDKSKDNATARDKATNLNSFKPERGFNVNQSKHMMEKMGGELAIKEYNSYDKNINFRRDNNDAKGTNTSKDFIPQKVGIQKYYEKDKSTIKPKDNSMDQWGIDAVEFKSNKTANAMDKNDYTPQDFSLTNTTKKGESDKIQTKSID